MSKECKIIKLKLTPVTPFFFGKENVSEMGNKNDYFQTSLEFPQQSTLLGFLRHKILRDNDINLDANAYKDAKNEATTLIGNEGFKENNNALNCYGKISAISPCFIIDENGEYLWDRSYEYVENKKKSEILCLSKDNDSFVWYDSIKSKNTNYLGKHFLAMKLNETSKKELIHSANYVGSFKGGKKPDIKEDSYYIMEYKTLLKKTEVHKSENVCFSKAKSLSFGFLACVAKDLKISELPDFMPMGKERSIFKVETNVIDNEIAVNENDIPDFYKFLQITSNTSSDIIKCVLLSDARLSNEEFIQLSRLSLMQVTSQQRLRFIKRKTEKFFSGAKPIKENKAYNLMAKGSVLFIKKENINDIESIFSQSKEFKQIGYNYLIFTNTI